ncbi:mandelate racemase/muconate lactonizing enzyme family protein [Klenkia taihuensis]|uniref:L-alanine-DL-glutamate epimerase n=1 Tax=Klenkia taihuensis TaxID=1225127 RepID=A0A1I1U0Z1_9ACTN|nr:enolase C-terminal domain-like protein [Klenkia taihuensis]GHE07001.1 muconate cycloisomerase [Klenkia taihuensis]SFD64429.1 L-alanine-DL-glutamate epimerase [Klenkia taihuensis]
MQIEAVRAIPFSIPYKKPLRFASGQVDVADHVLVQVVTSDGVVGNAEAPPRPYTYGETQASIVAVVRDLFAPAVTGLSVLDRELARARMVRTVGNPTAKAAVDMAMWDAWGKTVGQPVHRLLGGFTDGLQVSHMVGFDDPDVMAAEAARIRAEFGITSFKVKVGRRPIHDDVAVCRALREELGPDVELYLDGNRGWTSSESADALRRLADVGLSRVEELCPADDVLGRRWLVERCDVPFVADESVPTPADVTRELLAGSATAISLKTARTGFSDSLRIAYLAEGIGAEVVIGNQIDGQVGSACALAFGAALRSTSRYAAELSNFLDMADDLLTEPLRIERGRMAVRPGAGIGFEVDEDKLRHYRDDR